MNNSNREKMNIFIQSLKEALSGAGSQSEGIIGEVHADLEAHAERYQAKGHSEDDAVDLAIGEMGNPYELAHHMRREIPPFGGKVLTRIRYALASGLILWTLFCLWMFRAWVYGFNPFFVATIVLIHFPAILFVWPRIVWRKNWMFGLIPAGLSLLLAMFINIAGTEQHVPQTPVEEFSNSMPPAIGLTGTIVIVGLGMTALLLLISMQQRSQRRLIILAVLLGVGCVEAAFQGEELMFRLDRMQVRSYIETYFREKGSYPTDDIVKSERSKLRNKDAHIQMDGSSFSFYWIRPLNPGYSIWYSSANGSVFVQD
jgi:hypothetical protein